MKIGITGSTGHLGRLIINKLKEKVNKENIIALARSPEKGRDLGVEVRKFNYDEPQHMENSLHGIDTLVLVSASEVGKRLIQHEHIINAAKKSGIKWIVYTSLLHADNTSLNLGGEHAGTENFIRKSGIPFTFLRNGWYTENYTVNLDDAIAAGKLIGCAGDGKISSAARSDYADAVVAVVTGNGHQGKTYELAGDSYFTLKDLAAEVSKESGKNIPYINLSEKEYIQALKAMGDPEGFAKLVASWDTSASKGALYETDKSLSKLIGHKTVPMSKTVETTLKSELAHS